MTSTRDTKANELFIKAEKKLKKKAWFGIGKKENMEDAAELFVKAATQYKIAQNFYRAGESYRRAGDINIKAENDIDAMTQYKDAGNCFEKVDVDAAAQCFKLAIDMYLDNDRIRTAAQLHEKIADMLVEKNRFEDAIKAYEESIHCFELENDSNSANKRLLIIGHLCAKLKNYERAVQVFEKAADGVVDNNLLRWKVKDYLLKAMLCHICDYIPLNEYSKMRSALERYEDMSSIFAQSREGKFCQELITAVQNCDEYAFSEACDKFGRVSSIPEWENELLQTAKNLLISHQLAAPDLGPSDENKPNETQPTFDANEPIDYADAPDL